ncbi:MAG: DinB family protein [Spirochaetaceae bacterium]|jgi:uncharacterized damage-inducible protein DinB|nr:DinB family protein [Spirochaetaceae bacterium]
MKDLFLIFAEQNKAANHAVVHIFAAQPAERREEERGSYYKSLAGLLRHILGTEVFFAGLFKEALAHNPQAAQAIALISGITPPESSLKPEQWQELSAEVAQADDALISLVKALSPSDFQAPVAINWFGGNPATVPLSFLLQSLVLHNTHHRGQISQILDELKIDNDYSGINPAALAH